VPRMPPRFDSTWRWATGAAAFSYLEGGVDPALRLARELRAASRFEALLYQAKPEYRDHLFHVLRVCSVGYMLLTGAPNNCFGTLPVQARSDPLRNWCVAALCHDLGYMLELYGSISEMARGFASAHVRDLLQRIRRDLVQSADEMNSDAAQAGLSVALGNRMDHGVVSFLHLRRILRDIDRRRNPAGQQNRPGPLELAYQPALNAILRHNLVEEPIDAIREPLSALLVFCDELQEWGRWTVKPGELTGQILELINWSQVAAVQRRKLTEQVEFDDSTVSWASGTLRRTPGQDLIWLRVTYANQNQKDTLFEPLSVLLYKLFNFQRLRNTASLDLGLELRFKPLEGARELDVLADFVLEEDAAYIDPVLFTPASRSDRGQRAITYVRASGYDAIHVNLARIGDLASTPLLSRPPWEFKPDLYRFKRRWTRERKIVCRFFDKDDS